MRQASLPLPLPISWSPLASDRLPTNTTSRRFPIHRWFNFIAGYSPEFVRQCCISIDPALTPRLLDPFAGCATSLVIAKYLGIPSMGYEPHPVFARIGRAKVGAHLSQAHISAIEKCISCGFANPSSIESIPDAPRKFLQKLFSPPVLSQLLGAKRELPRQGLNDDLAFLILSRIVDLCSHSQTDGIYKAPTSRKRNLSPGVAMSKVISEIQEDLFATPPFFNCIQSSIVERSSVRMTEVSDATISVIVTSPPYLNNFDYAEMTRMLLYFWDMADSWADITKKVRSKLVVNTTTALSGHKDKQQEYRATLPVSVQAELDEIVSELAVEKKKRRGKKDYDYIPYAYMSQVAAILKECFRCLREGGKIHVMVADAALYGVHVATPQMLARLMQEIGFEGVTCELVRRRGHRWILSKRDGSARGLGEYYVQAVK